MGDSASFKDMIVAAAPESGRRNILWVLNEELSGSTTANSSDFYWQLMSYGFVPLDRLLKELNTDTP